MEYTGQSYRRSGYVTGPNLTRWPERAPKHLPLPETSLWYNLEVAATRYPRKTAVVFYDSVLSHVELRRSAEHLAGFLQQRCGKRQVLWRVLQEEERRVAAGAEPKDG
jgi:fatty-acyl-CoA synthase